MLRIPLTKSFKLSICANILFAVIIDALPYFSRIDCESSKLKNIGKVSIPSFVALSAISLAGSIPKTRNPSFLKKRKRVPSLEPISIINEFFD